MAHPMGESKLGVSGSISTAATSLNSTVPRSHQTLDCSPIGNSTMPWVDDALGLTEMAGGLFQDGRSSKTPVPARMDGTA